MIPIIERWALTFVLNDYLDIDSSEGFLLDGSLKEIAIKQGLKLLFERKIFTPIQLSREINKRIGITISSNSLLMYSKGVEPYIKLVKKTD